MTSKPTRPNRRGCMISTATRLFAENGFTNTTIREITRNCEVTEAAIYKHFKSKEHLYEEVILTKSRQHRIKETLAEMPADGTVADLFTWTASHILETVKSDPELMRMLLFCSLEGFSGAAILYQAFRQPYIHFLYKGLDARIEIGEIRNIDSFITSRCFVGMVMDCALNVELWNDLESTTHTAEMTVQNNVSIFARGLIKDPSAMHDGDPHHGDI